MSGIFGILGLLAAGGIAFVLFYKLYWEYKIDRKDVIEMLRRKGIGDRPETIVRQFYKIVHNKNLEEHEVKKLTKQFISNNKEFFLTMWENTQKKEKS